MNFVQRAPTFSVPIQNGEAKLRELILYVADRSQADPRFGAVKLNKILVYADFMAFYRTGTPITGVEYMRLPQGPVPRRMLPILAEMEQAHEVVVRTVQDGRYVQKRVIALRAANLELFTPVEISIVNEVIQAFWKKTATAVSEFSHGRAWKVAGDKGLIPYESVFISDDPPDAYDVARSEELAAELQAV